MTPSPTRDYVWVDVAIGGVDRRNHPRRIDEVQLNGKADCYASYQRATDYLATWVNNHTNRDGKPTVAGFDGATWTPFLPLDFDCADNPGRALGWLRQMLDRLEAQDVPLDAIRLYFSGRKGFGAEIPHTLFGGFEPGADLHAHLKRAAVEIMADVPFDHSLYDKLRLWRIPNSLNSKGRRYKIQLTLAEVRGLGMREIDTLAVNPRDPASVPGLTPVPDDDWSPNDYLIDVWRRACAQRETARERVSAAPSNANRDRLLVAATAASWPHGGAVVSRHADYLLPIAGFLAARMDGDQVAELLKAASLEANDPSFAGDAQRDWQSEIDRIAVSSADKASKGERVTGLPTIAAHWPELANVLAALWPPEPQLSGAPRPKLERLERLEHLETKNGHPDERLEKDPPFEHLEHLELGPRRQRLSEIAPERVLWLWQKYIPLGKHSELMGDPGLGKSIASTDIAARLTSGRAMPDGSTPELDGPCGVVFMAAEDDPADTIRPRFDAAGGSAELVEILHWAGEDEEHSHIPSVADLKLIAEAVADLNAKLLVIDPLTAHLPDGINMNRDNEVRRALAPLVRFLRQRGCASLAVRHLNKDQAMQAIYRGAGSIGLTGLARASFLVAPDPDDPAGERRVMAPGKINLGRKPEALPYEIVTSLMGQPLLRWGKPRADVTAANLLGASVGSGEDRSSLDEAKAVLTDILAAGSLPSETVKQEALVAGVSAATLRRAKDALGIKAVKDGPTGKWLWGPPNLKMLKMLKPEGEDAQPRVTNQTQDVQDAQGAQTGGLPRAREPQRLAPQNGAVELVCAACGQPAGGARGRLVGDGHHQLHGDCTLPVEARP
jgi:putative DNA primase/helicase